MGAKKGLDCGTQMFAVTPISAAAASFAAATGGGPTKGDERVQIIVRMTLSERKALRQIALDRDTTAQALAEDAIRNVLRRHGAKTD